MDWLIWLAQRMDQDSQTVFLIEGMQPNWLQTDAQKRRYRIAVRLIVGLFCGLYIGLLSMVLNYDPQWRYTHLYLIFGLIAGVISGVISGLVKGLSNGLIIGPISALILGLIGWRFKNTTLLLDMIIFGVIFGVIFNQISRQKIEPVDAIKWSGLETRNKWMTGIISGLISGLILIAFGFLIVFYELSDKIQSPWITNFLNSAIIPILCQIKQSGIDIQNLYGSIYNLVLGWLALGLYVGLYVGLIYGFKKELELERRTIPNQGIRRSAANAVKLLTIGGVVGGLISGLGWWIYHNHSEMIWWAKYGTNPLDGLIYVLIVGLMVGLMSSLIGGDNSGLVCIQHLILRLILWQRGCIPWNYARFLDYATERIFLQKVGGSYIFIHRLLLEHFASMHLPNNRSASNL